MKKIFNLKRKTIYLLVILSLAIPLLFPFKLPAHATNETKDFYEKIENLQPQSRVLVVVSFSASDEVEMKSQFNAVIKHLFSKKDIKMVTFSIDPTGLIYLEEYMNLYQSEYQKVSGKDFANLGYLYGNDNAIANFSKNIHKAAPTDHYGTPIENLSIMSNIKSGADFDLVINFGFAGSDALIFYLTDVYNVDFACGMQSIRTIQQLPYYASGQIDGLLNGILGAAGYESLLNSWGPANIFMNPLSTSSILIIVLIFIGNISYFINNKTKDMK